MAKGQKSWALHVVWLALLLATAGMAASRIGLLVHELIGHGGVAIALGGEVTELRLFWFGGGWIAYEFEAPTTAVYLACSLGGIVVEAVIGLVLVWGWRRADLRATAEGRTNLGVRIVRAIGFAFVVHACWYFATGTWHGYGDGIPTHRLLGDARYPAAIVAGLLACVAGFCGARIAIGAFAAVIPGSRRRTIAGVAIAMVTALAVIGGLAVAELALRDDTRYGAVMQRAGDRKAARELAAWQREQKRRGAVIDDAARAAELRRLRARHAQPPFIVPLAILLVASLIFGGVRRAAAPGARIERRQLAIAVAIGVGSVAVVIALDILFL